MIRVHLFGNMGKVLFLVFIAAVLLLIVGYATAEIAGAKKANTCFGTYLVDVTESEALWTISQDGMFQGTDSAEQTLIFSHQQGAWVSTGSNKAKATWLDFPTAPAAHSYARVDAELTFGSDCESMTGTFDVWLYLPSEDPLDRTTGGEQVIYDRPFAGRRVNP